MADPLVVVEQGDFYVAGRVITIAATSSSGENDPNPGAVVIDQMYVQYQIPGERRSPWPLIMVHGSWHTGKTYGSTPDGREGWATYFLRRGFAVYVVDDVNRGRSGYDMSRHNEVRLGMAEAVQLPRLMRRPNGVCWTGFRIGPRLGELHPGCQFPLESAEQYFAQLTYNYRGTEEDDKIVAALIALVDKIGPAILLTHSQSGIFGWRVAAARPNSVKGVLAIEPARLPEFTDYQALAKIPLLLTRGDFEPADADAVPQQFADNVNSAGGNATFVRLPKVGIHGNSHMMMLEKNNLAIADLLIQWIADTIR